MIKNYIETKDFKGLELLEEILKVNNLDQHLLNKKLFKKVLIAILEGFLIEETKHALKLLLDLMEVNNLEFIIIN